MAEHHAVLNCIPALEREGFLVTLLPVDKSGRVSVKELKEAFREDNCMVVVMSVNNEVGTVAPVAEIGLACKEREILFFSDAVAAVGHIGVNVKEQEISMLSLSGHKFGGPRGIGVLYVSSEIPVTNLMYGGGQEKTKRPGTQNVPGACAIAVALSESVANLDTNTQKLEQLRNRLLCGLQDVDGMWINGNETNRFPGIINLGFEGVSGEALMLLQILNKRMETRKIFPFTLARENVILISVKGKENHLAISDFFVSGG